MKNLELELVKNRHPKRPWYYKTLIIIAAIILIFSGSIGGGLILLARNPERAAYLTDHILRPILGDATVVSLERLSFSIQDWLNKKRYNQPINQDYAVNVALSSLTPTEAPSVTSNNIVAIEIVKPPPNLTPLQASQPPLANEGVWQNIANTDLYTCFIRTDADRPYAVVNLVYIPMSKYLVGVVAGHDHPGAITGIVGPGKVPIDIQDSGRLIAAFNGGFQEKDGKYGMVANGITYQPLRKNIATVFIHKNGKVTISQYDGKPLSEDIIAARQNGPLMVASGITAKNTSRGIDLWAGTASGGYVTWRSGVGITAVGDLIYAVGPSLTPTALADALRLAGSQNAMQLDINNYWVRFMIYQWSNKQYSWSTLVKGLADGGKSYLSGYEKDFFYIYKASP